MRLTSIALAWLELLLLSPCLAGAEPVAGTLSVLRVSVFDEAGVPVDTLAQAESEAGRILRQAGIQVVWLHCLQPTPGQISAAICPQVSFPAHLHLRILRASRSAGPSTLGMSFSAANGSGCYSDLFFEPILELERRGDISSGIILGHAFAHELGHLLLGANSHSGSGLMHARWDQEDLVQARRGTLLFSPAQASKMKSRFGQGNGQQ